MTFNLLAALPIIAPKALAWAEKHATLIAHKGQPLEASLVGIAIRVGVARPDQIRVLEVPQLPLPSDPELRQAALSTGLLGPGMVGLTLGYSIYICHGHGTMKYRSGAVYTGDFKNNEKDGFGVLTFVAGNTYTGEWVAGKRCGHGILTYAEGSNFVSYEGGFKNDMKHGVGKSILPNGRSFHATWEEDKKVN